MDFSKVILACAFIAASAPADAWALAVRAGGADRDPAQAEVQPPTDAGEKGGREEGHLAKLDRAFLESGAGNGMIARSDPSRSGEHGSFDMSKSTGKTAPDNSTNDRQSFLAELKAGSAPLKSDPAPAPAGEAHAPKPSGANAAQEPKVASSSAAAAPARDPKPADHAPHAAAQAPSPAPASAPGHSSVSPPPDPAQEPAAAAPARQPGGAEEDPRSMIADAKSGMGKSQEKRDVSVKPASKPARRNAAASPRRAQAAAPAPSRKASQVGTRDENGAVTAVHDGLEDVTASDLRRSGALGTPAFASSPWEDEVRRISGYSPGRPPLPDGSSAPSIADLDREAGYEPPKPRSAPRASRDFRAARRTAVYTRPTAPSARQAPSKAEADEARMLKAAPEAGRARIPDASGLVRN